MCVSRICSNHTRSIINSQMSLARIFNSQMFSFVYKPRTEIDSFLFFFALLLFAWGWWDWFCLTFSCFWWDLFTFWGLTPCTTFNFIFLFSQSLCFSAFTTFWSLFTLNILLNTKSLYDYDILKDLDFDTKGWRTKLVTFVTRG